MTDELNTPQPPKTEADYAALFLKERMKGYSVDAIAYAYGCPRADVRRLIKQELKKVEVDNRKKLIRQEIVKLDLLEGVAMRSALNEQGLHHEKATKSCLAIAARRAKLLGLDQPNRISMTDQNGNDMQPVLFYIPSNGRDDNGMPLVPEPDGLAA